MLIEAIEPLRVRLPDGQLRDMVPGQPVDLPDAAARKLLARAPDRVKVAGSPHLSPGTKVQWDSSLFGLLLGEVLTTYPDGAVLVWHQATERLVKIPLERIIQ